SVGLLILMVDRCFKRFLRKECAALKMGGTFLFDEVFIGTDPTTLIFAFVSLKKAWGIFGPALLWSILRLRILS
ncbi:MAG: hypothetical protein ABFS43_09535, partial [Thermodesulfobacteriota bacterium]